MRILFWVLLLLFLFGIAGGIAAVLYYQIPAEQTAEGTIAAKLLTSASASVQQDREAVPLWMIVLIGCFAILQVIPLLLAARISRSKSLTTSDMREVTFLCEVPMYLGLLGSLLGVCATQFLTGSLAAPLAYLTTISGIILYLLGRYTIWLPLPHEYARDEW